MNVYVKERYFGIEIFNEYKSLLGLDVLRGLRDAFDRNKKKREAISLSLTVKDMDYLNQAMRRGPFSEPRHYLDYANLLIEEVQSD